MMFQRPSLTHTLRSLRSTARLAAVAIGLVVVQSAFALPRVAILAAADTSAAGPGYADVQSKLLATGLFAGVDILHVTTPVVTPSLNTLRGYHAVIVWTNQSFNDSAAMGDVLANYVDGGGGVVLSVFVNTSTTANRFLTGRWLTDGYAIIQAGGGNSTATATLGTIEQPGHPILNGVNSLSSGTSARPSTNTLLAHGQRVINWSDGRPLVTVSSTFPRRVDLGLYPPSSLVSPTFWNTATDGGQLMGNALLYASGGSAASLVPTAGGVANPVIVFAGSSTTLSVTGYPGSNPASSELTVSADLQAFGGSASQALADAGGGAFAYTLNVPANQAPGEYIIPLTAGDAQLRSGGGSLTFRVIPALPAGFTLETEPNDTKAGSNAVTLSNGQGVYGQTTGTSTTVAGIGSADNFLITTAAASPGIYRHRMIITTSGTAGHAGTIRGLTQTTGTINTGTDATFQTSGTTTTPPRFNQWYGFGQQEQVHYRVTGTTTTLSEYLSTLETTPVIPTNVPTSMPAGPITIARALGGGATLDMLVYDSAFAPVADFMNESSNTFTRTFAPGTYYLAVSNINTADNRPTPADSTTRSASVLDFPGIVANSTTTTSANISVSFTAGAVAQDVVLSKDGPFEIAWLRFVVEASGGCQPADIADDQGTPLPSAGVNTGVNEGDYNAFFQGFFEAAPQCDIADDAGNPLPPFGPGGGVNSGVNEGDFNCFFQFFFNGCP